jgi:hypothetical protein
MEVNPDSYERKENGVGAQQHHGNVDPHDAFPAHYQGKVE